MLTDLALANRGAGGEAAEGWMAGVCPIGRAVTQNSWPRRKAGKGLTDTRPSGLRLSGRREMLTDLALANRGAGGEAAEGWMAGVCPVGRAVTQNSRPGRKAGKGLNDTRPSGSRLSGRREMLTDLALANRGAGGEAAEGWMAGVCPVGRAVTQNSRPGRKAGNGLTDTRPSGSRLSGRREMLTDLALANRGAGGEAAEGGMAGVCPGSRLSGRREMLTDLVLANRGAGGEAAEGWMAGVCPIGRAVTQNSRPGRKAGKGLNDTRPSGSRLSGRREMLTDLALANRGAGGEAAEGWMAGVCPVGRAVTQNSRPGRKAGNGLTDTRPSGSRLSGRREMLTDLALANRGAGGEAAEGGMAGVCPGSRLSGRREMLTDLVLANRGAGGEAAEGWVAGVCPIGRAVTQNSRPGRKAGKGLTDTRPSGSRLSGRREMLTDLALANRGAGGEAAEGWMAGVCPVGRAVTQNSRPGRKAGNGLTDTRPSGSRLSGRREMLTDLALANRGAGGEAAEGGMAGVCPGSRLSGRREMLTDLVLANRGAGGEAAEGWMAGVCPIGRAVTQNSRPGRKAGKGLTDTRPSGSRLSGRREMLTDLALANRGAGQPWRWRGGGRGLDGGSLSGRQGGDTK